MEGYLKLAVLKHLHRKPLAGYGLIQAIAEETGWKPSPGSMYPLLTALVKEGLATVKAQGRRRIYALTKHGAVALQDMVGQNRDRISRIASQLRVCSPNHPADKDMHQILERLSKGEAPFGWLAHELMELRKLAVAAGNQSVAESQKREVRKAFQDLLRALRNATK